ncbi:MAG: hypothetical protein ACT4PU_10465 [Planctomycetota bacterium]
MGSAAHFLAIAMAVVAPMAAAQGPGDPPRLVLTDGKTLTVPGPAGPWDNTGVFPALSGQSFSAQLTYQSAGQPNNNVLWGLLVSLSKTPLPLNVTPPVLLTMPPFVLMQAAPPTLSLGGFGAVTLFVPAGVYGLDTYVQGILYDVSSVPALRLSNGLRVEVEVPDFNANFGFVRNFVSAGPGAMGDAGQIDLDGDTLKTLRPIGTAVPPEPIMNPHHPHPGNATVVTQDPLDTQSNFAYRFLPIVPNLADAPVNPLARPVTKIAGTVGNTDTTIPVESTEFFPRRGSLLIAIGTINLWADRKDGNKTFPPTVEVVNYDGITPTSFLNCQRGQLGSHLVSGAANFPHSAGQFVIGDFTMASSASARLRDRVCLDASNGDLPHVVIPSFTFNAGGDVGQQTRDLNLYLYETLADQLQGFMVLDRVTGEWEVIPGTSFNIAQGRWDPVVHVAPDRRTLVASLRVSGGVFGWNNDPDRLFLIRLDGLSWPASGTPVWEVAYQVEANPVTGFVSNVRSRRVWMRSASIIGPNPDNYVLFVGLKHKWRQSTPTPGQFFSADQGYESEWVRDDVLVRDLIEVPLIQPGSTKALPAIPRPYITTQFGNTGFGNPVKRFDPEMLISADGTRLFLVAGSTNMEEDAFIIRNVTVNPDGTVAKLLVNISGIPDTAEIRSFQLGGHGTGQKAALSPDGSRAAWLVRDESANTQRKDWLNVAFTSGASYAQVVNVYQSGVVFQEPGELTSDRVITGLRFLDNTRLIFMMGRARYDDPTGITPANAPGMDLFSYNTVTGVITNRTLTDPTGTPFQKLGKIVPGGYFASNNGGFAYIIRMGGIGTAGGSVLPAGTAVANILGVNTVSLQTFPVTGDELDGSALIGNLTLPSAECVAPFETAASMQFAHASGGQAGLTYFVAHRQNGSGGNGADDIFAVNRDTPFVAFEGTQAALPGVHVTNLVPSPVSARFAFARGDTADRLAANQHAFVVDLDNFLYERDVTSIVKVGNAFLGRVMDGSMHFVPPTGDADDALVFSFGLGAVVGIAAGAAPIYYPLGASSNPVAEPVPVLVPLIDTAYLGNDFRFYLTFVRPSQGN